MNGQTAFSRVVQATPATLAVPLLAVAPTKRNTVRICSPHASITRNIQDHVIHLAGRIL